jgi:hypothetical protein
VRQAAAMGAVTLSHKLSYLSKFAIKLVGMFEAESWKKPNSTAFDSLSHQDCGDFHFFTSVFCLDLHLAQTNNGVQPDMITTTFMAFARRIWMDAVHLTSADVT